MECDEKKLADGAQRANRTISRHCPIRKPDHASYRQPSGAASTFVPGQSGGATFLAIPSLLGHLADPMIYMFGLGYRLGSVMSNNTAAFSGVSYIAFLAAGTVSASTMNAASFEALYSVFSRMHVQRTWEAILLAPLSLDDILLGELLWAGLTVASFWLAMILTRRRLLI